MLQDAVLSALHANKGKLVTGGELSNSLQVSRNSIWKSISKLREDGHDIVSFPNKGYVLDIASDGLSEKLIKTELATEGIGAQLEVLKTVDSTNSYLKTLASDKTEHGMVIVANEQTRGRGRFNRQFESPQSEGIYMSICLKPQLPLGSLPLLTYCAAVSVAQAIERCCSLQPAIKWVNDVLLNQCKVCGILTEISVSAELRVVDYAVVGIGINTGKLPRNLNGIATTIKRESGKTGLRNSLIATTLTQFEKHYLNLERGDWKVLLKEYEARLCLIGKKVKVFDYKDTYEMTVKGIDEEGALVGVDRNGLKLHISAGEICEPKNEATSGFPMHIRERDV